MKKALEQAIEICGTQTALAKILGKRQSHVSFWLRRGWIPAEQAMPIEKATGISRHDLRPDIYPKEKTQ